MRVIQIGRLAIAIIIVIDEYISPAGLLNLCPVLISSGFELVRLPRI